MTVTLSFQASYGAADGILTVPNERFVFWIMPDSLILKSPCCGADDNFIPEDERQHEDADERRCIKCLETFVHQAVARDAPTINAEDLFKDWLSEAIQEPLLLTLLVSEVTTAFHETAAVFEEILAPEPAYRPEEEVQHRRLEEAAQVSFSFALPVANA